MANQHSRLIAETASAALSPLGLVRKGESRIWLDDQSWWLGVAEFKPSNWKPGAYLNVGLMFLWHPADHYIFEIGGQVEGFSPADSTDFVQAAHAKAERAAKEIGTLRANFRSADDVIRYYAPISGRTSIYGQANLATALGLVGNMEHCRRALDRALRQREGATVNLKMQAPGCSRPARPPRIPLASARGSWLPHSRRDKVSDCRTDSFCPQSLRFPDVIWCRGGGGGHRANVSGRGTSARTRASAASRAGCAS